MKTKKLFLDFEEENTLTNIGLLRLAEELKPHELFFKINTLNAFCFKRIKDLIISKKYFSYHFYRFEAYHHLSKNCIQIISNKSSESHQIKVQKELFNTETPEGYLFDDLPAVDYIIRTTDFIDDFSLILWPENSVFQIQTFPICSLDERYQLIQYYE